MERTGRAAARKAGLWMACCLALQTAWAEEAGRPETAAQQPAARAAAPKLPSQVQDSDPAVRGWTERGFQELTAGRLDEAVDAFQQALAASPRSARARFGLGTAYIRMERCREALEILVPMVEEFPRDPSLKNNVAWLYATAKDPTLRDGAKAAAYAQDALLIAPGDFHIWSTLAEAYYVSGQYEKALRTAEEALRLGRDRRASARNLQAYREQVIKCRKAVEAMSLME